MAEETVSNTTRKAAPKRKTGTRKAAPRQAAQRKSTARTTGRRGNAGARRKSAARSSASTKRTAGRGTPALASKAREAGRSAFLASLGFYGKAFDQVQEQFGSVQDQLAARRKKADKYYAELVKRGEKVEKQARSAFEDLELPRLELDGLTDRKQLEARLEKARERFDDFRQSVGLRKAA